MATVPQPFGKPPTPPPAYTELPDPRQPYLPPDQSTSTPPNAAQSSMAASPFPFAAPAHAGYGPTPIAEQVQLLPYYDPRSSYAVAEANHRARWRFIEAAVWAVVILSVVSFVTGWEVKMMMARGVGDGHHRHRGHGLSASE